MAFCQCKNCKGSKNEKCVLKRPFLREKKYCDFEANEEYVKIETIHDIIKKIRRLRTLDNRTKMMIENRIKGPYYFGTETYYKKKVK